jgi:hypothetical protein
MPPLRQLKLLTVDTLRQQEQEEQQQRQQEQPSGVVVDSSKGD